MFFSKGDTFEGLADYLAPGLQATILDTGLLDIDAEAVQAISNIEFLQIKTNLLIKQYVQKYCIEGCKLVDLFSNGYVAELGLALEKEVICLVENIEDKMKLETRLIAFAKPKMRSQIILAMTIKGILQKKHSVAGKVRSAADFLNAEDSM